MLGIKFIKKNLDLVKEKTRQRGLVLDWNFFSKTEKKLRNLTRNIEKLRSEKNKSSDKIADIKSRGEDIKDYVFKMKELSLKIKLLEDEELIYRKFFTEIVMKIPNLFHNSVPIGNDENSNFIYRKEGKKPVFSFKPLSHWELGERLKLFDFASAAKISGSRFPLLTGLGSRMERALINFMIDIHTLEHGYYELSPPFIVNENSLIATGQLPKFKDDLFKIDGKKSYLIPTAEVPLVNMYRNRTFLESDLPISSVAYSPCFRSEAGSYGKDVRGLLRQHQFSKVELVKFSKPDESYNNLNIILRNAEIILQRLGLHYRIVILCSGDLGFAASKTYDIEVWLPFQEKYREISSCSNCEDFQSRRANIRVKNKNGKGSSFVHTLNASGLAIGRTIAAIIENYQRSDGSISIPSQLIPYMGGVNKIY